MNLKLQKLKREMSTEMTASFKTIEFLGEVSGWSTGLKELDQFLIWKGLPKNALSLFIGPLGLGATSFWTEAAAQVTAQKKWAAWIGSEAELCPLPLQQKKIDLSRVLNVKNPNDEKKLLWLLQELMSCGLFELIGCDLNINGLREHQLRKLQNLARKMKTSLLFCTQNETARRSSVFSLILYLKKNEILIERALHRPSPHLIARRLSYDSFTRFSTERLQTEIIFERLEPANSVLNRKISQQPTQK
jgi:recombination protein RecA